MPKLWKFLSKAADNANAPEVQDYRFADTRDIVFPQSEPEPEPPEDALMEEEAPVEITPESDPLAFARIQSEQIMEDARRRAEEILEDARRQAQELAAAAREAAEEDGYQAGLRQGIAQGTAQALEEGRRAQDAQARRLEEDIAAFLNKAQEVLDRQLDENVDQLRDLALAVAEKVVCVSLKSSTQVIGKMIQTAVDKRRRREWVHIYVAESDARKLVDMPASLISALSALSDRVRIIPMADDEEGSCIIEMPDEIIDASAATQMNNIRSMLADTPMGGRGIPLRIRSEDRVSGNDPAGVQHGVVQPDR